jgi:hypothetical protein
VRSTQPPRIANWLLRHFGSSLYNDAIIGDLNEQYLAGRSHTWYWLQTLNAVVVSFTQQIRNRSLSTLFVPASCYVLLRFNGAAYEYFAVRGAANPLTAHVFAKVLPSVWWGHNAIFWPIDLLLTYVPLFVISLCTGWLVAQFNIRRKEALILAFLVFATCVMRPGVYDVLYRLATEPRHSYFSLGSLLAPTQELIGIAFGGGLLAWRRSASLKES